MGINKVYFIIKMKYPLGGELQSPKKPPKFLQTFV